ncbi:MAG: hypothetical protein MUO99_05640 [Dehalococcoidales bacterium]|nr:hypothetical protein [Dehalococcoidales bacterium]
MMEVLLFAHGKRGGFESKEDLRHWLSTDLRERNGMYALARLYDVPSQSLALFEIKGCIVGCGVIREGAREMTEEERKWREEHRINADWKATMWIDPVTIWVWPSSQDVRLKEVGISFSPGPPVRLNATQALEVFHLVAERRG